MKRLTSLLAGVSLLASSAYAGGRSGVDGTLDVTQVQQSTAVGYSRQTVSASAVSITPPSSAAVCYAIVEGNAVRYRTDKTDPTATVGMPLAVGVPLTITAPQGGIRFIAQTGSATLNLDCYQ